MLEWIKANDNLFWWATAASVATFIISLIIVPVLIARIPADYFVRSARPQRPWEHLNPALRIAMIIGKNVLGGLLILVGLVMIPLPGQGVLTLVIGLMLVDFPGKYRFERWLISRERVFKAVNWVRNRAGREPIYLDECGDGSPG